MSFWNTEHNKGDIQKMHVPRGDCWGTKRRKSHPTPKKGSWWMLVFQECPGCDWDILHSYEGRAATDPEQSTSLCWYREQSNDFFLNISLWHYNLVMFILWFNAFAALIEKKMDLSNYLFLLAWALNRMLCDDQIYRRCWNDNLGLP